MSWVKSPVSPSVVLEARGGKAQARAWCVGALSIPEEGNADQPSHANSIQCGLSVGT
jgi:hypothetical protein